MASAKGDWQNLSTPDVGPGITCHIKPNPKKYDFLKMCSLCLRKWNLWSNLTETTQSLPLHVCISTGADHYNKYNFYKHPPPAKHVAICIYFMVCLIIHTALALNTIMVSTLVDWLCCYRQLALFAKLVSLIFITNRPFRLLYLQILE